jgi:serine protease
MPVRKGLVIFGCVLLCALFRAPAASSSNDTYWSSLWGIRKVGADKAWSVGTGKGSTIAVVDTGVDRTHPDLKANVVAGYDFVDKDKDPSDEFGHGTHVAGTAAAVANNGIGVAGVAPDAKIMPVRVLGSDGTGSSSTVDDGIRWAADHGATVINLSLGDGVVFEDASGGSMTDACNYAWSKGSICVVSSGNDQFMRTDIQDAKAIIVTATGPDDTKASYATADGLVPWGMAAPGGTNTDGTSSEILSTYWSSSKGSGYAYAMGTSMAAPHVSGAAAILRGLGLTPQETVNRLLSTATKIGSSFTYGHGLLNVAAAVAGMQPAHTSTAHTSGASSAEVPSAPSGASSSSSSSDAVRAAHPGRTTTTANATASPPVRNGASATASPGLALFSPSHTHPGSSNGWAFGLVGLGAGLAALGVYGFRRWRRAA